MNKKIVILLYLFISYVFSYKIGYLYEDGKSEVNILAIDTDYNNHLNTENPDKVQIEIVGKKYDGSENDIQLKLKEFYAENITVIYVYCTENIYKTNETVLQSYGILFWCLNPLGTGECRRSIVAGSSYAATIESRIYFYFLSLINSICVIDILWKAKFIIFRKIRKDNRRLL